MTLMPPPDRYTYPGENQALTISVLILAVLAFGVVAISFGIAIVIIVVGLFLVRVKQGHDLGSSMVVTPNSYAKIHDIATQAASAMGLSPPRVHVKQDPYLNAYATGFAEPYSIVLHSALVQAMDERELRFIVAHEMSHVRSQHTRWLSLTAPLGTNVPGFSLIFGSWQRKAEYTCDRAGLLFCGDVAASIRAMIKLASGPNALQATNVAEFVAQAAAVATSPAAELGQLLLDHPYATHRVAEILRFSKTALFLEQSQSGHPCRFCGHIVDPAAKFCTGCGKPVTGPRSCSSCREIVAPEDDFCTKCGANLRGGSARCANCSVELAADAAFCTACGARVVTQGDGVTEGTVLENL